jgi:hypothetical protein
MAGPRPVLEPSGALPAGATAVLRHSRPLIARARAEWGGQERRSRVHDQCSGGQDHSCRGQEPCSGGEERRSPGEERWLGAQER